MVRIEGFDGEVVALDATVLAFRAQNAPVQVRRSEDGGATWGPIIEVGDNRASLGAAIVDEQGGDVLVFQGRHMFRSSDVGKTWHPEDVIIKSDGLGGVGTTHGADSGITLRFGEHEGRFASSRPGRSAGHGQRPEMVALPL